ncbi:major tail protein [Paucilactobacillus vaccinostercus DSM 20634]|jgi:Bacterial surface proteins containing Ig-like domains|uniref:Major tail protein n=1 Tax=Paucilactobacillus vaccinostercus DSM 20634 TaxID=1423813 RepID=A0A0R2A253_9LACO|nr:Ig-like domain-containing protein [Paucilactobacillus vaccinostercus]KRM61024.1 major tail protein [Paucilactobacillus vaccinostercus DSM 20634]
MAISYNIYQKEGDTANWTKLGTATAKTYTVNNLKPKTEYTFAVTATNGLREGDKTAVVTVTTANIATTAVTIAVDTKSLEVGGTAKASVTITPADETDGAASYTSDTPAVASVDASTGAIKALKEGKANITAKVGTITSAAISVTVYAALVTVTNLAASGTTTTGTTLTWS